MKIRAYSVWIAAALTLPLFAQQPDAAPPVRQARDPKIVAGMPAIAEALGVDCRYCHLARRGMPVPEPKKDIARAMMKMTSEINLEIQAASGKNPDEVTEVRCVTCHRGVTIPGQLSDILVKTAAEQGAGAAIAQYRDLRARYYGRASYDFGDETLLTLATRLGYRDADEAIAVLQLNLEFNPKSAKTYIQLANAFARKLEDKEAIACLEKALELDPSNSLIKGQLAQLKSYKRNRQ